MTAANEETDAERRRYPRTSLSILVQYRSESFEDFLADYALNLSLGGIFVSTDKPRPEGSIIYLQFSLADGSRLVEGMGRVVRVNPAGTTGRTPGMGIEFLHFDEPSMQLIEQILEHATGVRSPREPGKAT
jgi:uncharacterized protein (TIGR02266 family)